MKFELIAAKNGFVLEMSGNHHIERLTYQGCDDDESAEIHRFQEFLHAILDNYGPQTNRYSKERIYITIAPGDKCDD